MNYIFALALAIGFAAGLRSLTPPAVIAWAAHLGRFNLHDSTLAFLASTPAVVLFSLFAVAELIGDKLPGTQKRIALLPLLTRILMGGLSGAAVCVATGSPLIAGAALGGIGAVIGAFAGYEIRRRLVANLGLKDFPVALVGDLVAIGLACMIVLR